MGCSTDKSLTTEENKNIPINEIQNFQHNQNQHQNNKDNKINKDKDNPNFNQLEETGSMVNSHNNNIPGDTEKYLNIKFNNKKNGVFIPTPNDLERFRKDGLKRHNYYWKYHQSGPLELTKKLNDYAQNYAEHLASINQMEHSPKDKRNEIYGDWTGENLYYFWSSDSNLAINGAEPIDSWYDEINDYDFSNGRSKNGGIVGHFTQLVWNDSTQLGLGAAKSTKNSVYVVANYHFGGNFNSAELKNVFPAKA